MERNHQGMVRRFITNSQTEVFVLGKLLDVNRTPYLVNLIHYIVWSTKEMMEGMIVDGQYRVDITGLKLQLGKAYFNIGIGTQYSAQCSFISATETTITSQICVTSATSGDLICKANATGYVHNQNRARSIPMEVKSALEDASQKKIPSTSLASNHNYVSYRTVTVTRPSEIGEDGCYVEVTNYINYCIDGIQQAISANSDFLAVLRPEWLTKIRSVQIEINSTLVRCQKLTIDIQLYTGDGIIWCKVIDDSQDKTASTMIFQIDLDPSNTVSTSRRLKPELKISPLNPLEVQILCPQLGYYRDRFRNCDLGKMLRIIGELRIASWLEGFMDWDQFFWRANYGAVIASHRIRIKPNVYNLEKKSDVDVYLKLLAIGKSSFSIRHLVTARHKPKEHLMDILTALVFTQHLKPRPLHANFANKYAKLVEGQKMPNKIIPFVKKSHNTFSHVIRPRECEIDTYSHVTNAVYVTYCLDAASLAIRNRSSAYRLYHLNDFNPQSIYQIDIVYVKQVRRAEEVIIETWQDNSSNLNFDIRYAKNNETACRACFYLANSSTLQPKL
ncbi:uncharacterized protein TRIADDRAFT_57415 [Trichoplax adhaerens]|uniref:Acyl-ACP thioesterase-like C-terminal domain-containing protein n=1 Tax=Trichoplax adhaerens TaxID=10228 RepID=B3RZD8_TRIAD|nr:predicted protein [Trichoplax adhaerens]EDV24184.1 predicted protein [Trichoplax adhaerens]|eukprot:XP_002113710.1 predicted protein [Trichoplax adhaerens]